MMFLPVGRGPLELAWWRLFWGREGLADVGSYRRIQTRSERHSGPLAATQGVGWKNSPKAAAVVQIRHGCGANRDEEVASAL